MAHRRENNNGDTAMSDKENRSKLEKGKKKFSSSSCSSSDSSSSSFTSTCSSSSYSSSGSSSRSSSSSSSSSARVIKRKEPVQKVRKTSLIAHVISEKKGKPLKGSQDKSKKLEKLKPKAELKGCTVSPRRKHMRRSPSPRSAKIHIGQLTRNITREHLNEIFSTFGKIKAIDFPMDRSHPNLGKGFAYAEFETPDEAENAMKHMDGAQIDGQEITAAPVLVPRTRQVPVHRLSPVPVRRPLQRWGRSALRYRHNSPPYVRGKSPLLRRRPRSRLRSRTRSPARRRRYSCSSSSRSR